MERKEGERRKRRGGEIKGRKIEKENMGGRNEERE